jgi:hypothetical protein
MGVTSEHFQIVPAAQEGGGAVKWQGCQLAGCWNVICQA